MRERFEQRLFRIFAQAGYSPVQLLTITPEEMVEVPGITVPNIRAVLCVQNKVLADRNKVRSGRLVEELLKEAEESLLIKSQALFENFCEVILWHNSKTASSAGQKESRNRRNDYSFCSRLRRCAFTLP